MSDLLQIYPYFCQTYGPSYVDIKPKAGINLLITPVHSRIAS